MTLDGSAMTFFGHMPWLGVYFGHIPAATQPIKSLLDRCEELTSQRIQRGSRIRDLFHYIVSTAHNAMRMTCLTSLATAEPRGLAGHAFSAAHSGRQRRDPRYRRRRGHRVWSPHQRVLLPHGPPGDLWEAAGRSRPLLPRWRRRA